MIGVFGHTATFDAGCFGYISDVTSKEERTKRMGFALGIVTNFALVLILVIVVTRFHHHLPDFLPLLWGFHHQPV